MNKNDKFMHLTIEYIDRQPKRDAKKAMELSLKMGSM